MTTKSEIAYWDATASSEKFDYYICGLVATVVAFAFRDLKPGTIEFTPYGLKLFSIVILIVGVVYGLKRIEQVNVQKWRQHGRLYNQETVAKLSDAKLPEVVQNMATGEVYTFEVRRQKIQNAEVHLEHLSKMESEVQAKTRNYYKRRNWAFIVGCAGLILAKIWAGYAPYLPR